jgi:hypothetical protein
MSKVNVDGVKVNSTLVDLMDKINRLKQSALLERARCRVQVQTFSLHDMVLEAAAGLRAVTQRLTYAMADYITANRSDLVTTKPDEFEQDKVVHELEVFVLSMEELKHVVEYCIKTMPDEAVNKIRNNG